jgi:pimeloyl-ACP methyl ester carboxylesterase
VTVLLGQKVNRSHSFGFLFFEIFDFLLAPIINRINLIDKKIPIYFLHGEKSWITIDSSLIIQSNRSNVFVDIINGAGHHVSLFLPIE